MFLHTVSQDGNELTVRTALAMSISLAKLALGWALIPANFDPIQEIGPKVGGAWALFQGWALFCETTVLECIPVYLSLDGQLPEPYKW